MGLVPRHYPSQIPKSVNAQFSSVQSLSHVRLFATPWTAAHQASLSITNSPSLLKLIWAPLKEGKGFPGSSAGKESACSAGDPGSIPVSRISPGEGIGYPLQYSWASLVAQLVKNLPTVWGTWVRSLGWKDPPEEGMATHSSSCLENPTDRRAWWATAYGVAKSQTQLSD